MYLFAVVYPCPLTRETSALVWRRPSKDDPRTVPRVEVDPVNFQLFHYRLLFIPPYTFDNAVLTSVRVA